MFGRRTASSRIWSSLARCRTEPTGVSAERPRRIEHRDPEDALVVVAIEDANSGTRALDELHACQERYQTLVDTAQDGIWTIDASGNTTFANHSMAAMLGTTVGDMIGKPSFTYVFEEDVPHASELFNRKVEGDREPFEFRLRRKDGSWFWASVTGTPFHNTRGETTGLLGTFRDITEPNLPKKRLRGTRQLARRQPRSNILAHNVARPSGAASKHEVVRAADDSPVRGQAGRGCQ